MAKKKEVLEPIVIRPADVDEDTLAHLFSIVDDKGRETKYYVRTEIAPNDSLKAMHLQRTQGDQALEMFGMELALGKEGYFALMECSGVTWEHLEAISTYAANLLGGAGKGQAGGGPRRSPKGSRK